MEISILLAEQIAGLFLMMLTGFLIVKIGVLTAEDSKIISKIAMYILMPCVIINSFQVDYTPEVMKSLAIAFAMAIVVHVVWILLAQIVGKVIGLNEVEQASIIYPNAGNLIVPLVIAIFGDEWLMYTSAMISVQIVIIWTHGKRLISREKEISLKKIVTNVNMIAVFIGLMLCITRLHFPVLLGDTIKNLASTIGPMTMIVTGMLIGGISFKEVFGNKRVYLVAFLRLVGFSMIALILLRFLPIRGMIENGETIFLVILLACSAPSAAAVTQMAQVYDNDGAYAGAINVVTTLLCIVTMPIMVMLYYL